MEIKEILNEFMARSIGVEREKFEGTCEQILLHLNRVQNFVAKTSVPKDLSEYNELMSLKSLLSTLFCYAFNSGREYKKIGKLESDLGLKLYKFVRKHVIKDVVIKAAAKYVVTCMRYYYVSEDQEKIVKALVDAGVVRKYRYSEAEPFQYAVVGLHYAVGDNSFSLNRGGKYHRNFVRTCTFQAFPVKDRFYNQLEKHRDSIPALPNHYKITCVAPSERWCARIYLNKNEKAIIKKEFCS